MILPLRQRHRRVFAVIGVLLPIFFVVGIAARRTIPLQAMPGLAVDLRTSETEVWKRTDIFSKVPVKVRLLRGPMSSWYAVAFEPGRGFARPDLLVYWVTDAPTIAGSLPDDARLLGSFNPSIPLQLPSEASTAGGVLVLYSLADNEIVDVSKPTRFNDSAK
jgi:hypothetical protein